MNKSVISDKGTLVRKTRNPDWTRDEIMLALDLYFSPERGSIDKKNPKIIDLSKVLRSLPNVVVPTNFLTFRNANSVARKLANFQSFDSSYKGKGLDHASGLDKSIFNEFFNDKERLKSIAAALITIAENEEIKKQINSIEDDDVDRKDSVDEGRILYKFHKVRERNRAIVEKKKRQAIEQYGKLECEVCSFVFVDYYGEIGSGFIECHHTLPLSGNKVMAKTRLEDLALVCANCHRMLHKTIGRITIEMLKAMIEHQRAGGGNFLF